jgi:hypothetical protein
VPDNNSIETCLANVRSCDEFVIVLSNRYGPSLAKAGFGDISATHLEYLEALKYKKRIHMFVRDRLDADYSIWQKNQGIDNLELLWCKNQHDWKIFKLLAEHRQLSKDTKNNWFWTFRDSADLKRRLAREFKEVFARVEVEKLAQNGRVPFLEITGQFLIFNPQQKKIEIELYIRNLSDTVVVSPKLQILDTVNSWEFKSLTSREQIRQKIEWAYNAPISLSTRLSYLILEGQKFFEEGVLTINHQAQPLATSTVRYTLKERKYDGAATEMMLT